MIIEILNVQISSQLYESYIDEEDKLKDEWNEICKTFQEKVTEKNERLSRKFYQLFKEQTSINYDDVKKIVNHQFSIGYFLFLIQKFQEQIRTYFANSNENIQQLLNKEIPNKLLTYSRQCYVNVATCLQKRAYDTINDIASDMHKQMVRFF